MVQCQICGKPFDEAFGVCPHCGFIPGSKPKEAYHLHPGVMLRNRYVIGSTVGFGGFGITYRAWDKTLDKMVAIKEFYPNGIVNRVPGEKEVIIYSGNRANEFQNGKVRFLAEARNMAMFNTHPNIVNVYEFFEENNTAYIAMEFLEGKSYKQYIAEHGGRVDSQTAVSVVLSVLDALRELHRVKIIHRDISPDNIFLIPVEAGSENYKVKLIDFGAARFSSGEEEKTLSIILKPGYAPPEQYRTKSKQGPWTDIYAVGAVLYRSLTGRMPEESVNRMVEDHLPQPKDLAPEIPQYLNDSIMRAMALNQELRFQNVDQFRDAIQNKAKVLSVDGELKRRKVVRGISIAGICVLLAIAGVVCQQVYARKERAMYNLTADLTVWMPDVNQEKMEEVSAVGSLLEEDGDVRQITLSPSGDMLNQMLEEYKGRFTKVNIAETFCGVPQEYQAQGAKDYGQALAMAAQALKLPEVFESSSITPQDALWENLGSLDTTYEMLDKNNYYFMKDDAFAEEFEKRRQKKQMPVSFCAPVLYVNTFMAEGWEGMDLEKITSTDSLVLDGEASFCVSSRELSMYQQAFADAGLEAGGEMGYEPFLKKEKAFYLGTTDDYEAVRASLGGIYKMVVLEDLQKAGKVQGRFTHFWSIDGSLEGEEKRAADSLVYYFIGESAQDVFNLQNGNGLSLNKNMLEIYVEGNDEFADVAEQLKYLTMQEYGEGSKE